MYLYMRVDEMVSFAAHYFMLHLKHFYSYGASYLFQFIFQQ